MSVPARRARRPVDKKLVTVSKDGVDGTQVTTVLVTATFPATVVGLRWSLSFFQDAGTGTALFRWAFVIVRDGVTIDTLALGDASNFFNPEENCLIFGQGMIDNNTETKDFEGSTKTMRKLQGGDTLVFVGAGATTNTVGIRGIVQFFLKT